MNELILTITWRFGGIFPARRRIEANNKWSNSMISLLQIQNTEQFIGEKRQRILYDKNEMNL